MVVEWFAIVGLFDGVKQLRDFSNVLRGHAALDVEHDHVLRLSISCAVQ